jgi:hypothetical protein
MLVLFLGSPYLLGSFGDLLEDILNRRATRVRHEGKRQVNKTRVPGSVHAP